MLTLTQFISRFTSTHQSTQVSLNKTFSTLLLNPFHLKLIHRMAMLIAIAMASEDTAGTVSGDKV